MTKLVTKLEIKSWDEKPYRVLDDGSKFTRSEVTLAGTPETSWKPAPSRRSCTTAPTERRRMCR